jgi:hypothetical protein
MADIDLKRSTPGLQPKRPRFNSFTAESDKLRTYHTLYRLNRAFELVSFNLGRLEELGFRHKFLTHFRHRAEELRADANLELVETLNKREQQDWTWYGRHALRWERQHRDPNDVLLEAESQRKKQRQRKQKPTRKQ